MGAGLLLKSLRVGELLDVLFPTGTPIDVREAIPIHWQYWASLVIRRTQRAYTLRFESCKNAGSRAVLPLRRPCCPRLPHLRKSESVPNIMFPSQARHSIGMHHGSASRL
jgi:hypothetical protein